VCREKGHEANACPANWKIARAKIVITYGVWELLELRASI
jgi:hypothetical protein